MSPAASPAFGYIVDDAADTLMRNPTMAEVTIRLRDSGPLVVEGPVTITDAEGNAFALDSSKPAIALCRCGQSANRPFCDGEHNRCGFESNERAG